MCIRDRAKAVHKDIRVLRWPFAENDRAVAEHEAHGHIKVITNAKGKILGAGIVGPRAGELISLWTLAPVSYTHLDVYKRQS